MYFRFIKPFMVYKSLIINELIKIITYMSYMVQNLKS